MPQRWKSILILGGAGALVAVALLLAVIPLLQRPAAPGLTTRTVIISMAGFTPSRLRAPANQPITLTLVNTDSKFHTDGGVHQFAIDALNLDVRIAPRAQEVITLGPLRPGRYQFYCDICCGGRENPTMLGTLEVHG